MKLSFCVYVFVRVEFRSRISFMKCSSVNVEPNTHDLSKQVFPKYSCIQECPVWSVWGQWGSCSATCGAGIRRRARSCIKSVESGVVCDGESDNYGECNSQVNVAGKKFVYSFVLFINCSLWEEVLLSTCNSFLLDS